MSVFTVISKSSARGRSRELITGSDSRTHPTPYEHPQSLVIDYLYSVSRGLAIWVVSPALELEELAGRWC
jgi:hypothetical protein